MMKSRVADNDTLNKIPAYWNIEIESLVDDAFFTLSKGQVELVALRLNAKNLEAKITFTAHPEAPVLLQGQAVAGDAALICNTGNRIALYINRRLQDEDWPLGTADLSGATCRTSNRSIIIHDGFSFNDTYLAGGTEETVTDISVWRPEGSNTSIGDCMPFVHDGVYRLFYLYDRRHHKSKWQLGAHQWAQISTRDFQTWRTFPLAIPIDHQYEGSICTGSLIFSEGVYYAFYAVRMSDLSPAKLTYAISSDGVRFKKSNRFITLGEPYEPVSARDPKVFFGADGQFHMLVTTSLAGKGCLAHLTSTDLECWVQQDPFIALSIENQPECPDYFTYKGHYYLVYSNFGTARYFVSQHPFGPWKAPHDNVVGHDKLRVPKAAILSDHLVFAGFVANRNTYGGHFSLYEAQSHSEGRLTFSPLR